MKNEKTVYVTGIILILTGAVLKLLNLPYGGLVFLIGLSGTVFFQARHLSQLKKRIRELESKPSYDSETRE